MIDLHCHLDLYENPLEVAQKASRENIFTLAVTTSPRAWMGTSRVFKNIENIEVALGLHPEIFAEKIKEIGLLIDNIKNTKFVGEVGIDGSVRYKATLQQQTELFEKVVHECEEQGGKVISIHSRKAEQKVLDVISQYPKAGTPILHWFSGSMSQLQRAIDLGCWFSGGPAMTQSENGINLLKAIPINRFLPESDGPFTQISGKPIMPWQAAHVIRCVSKIKNLTEKEVDQTLRSNLERLRSKLIGFKCLI
ncbi:MAG: Qat anti-phage system TatD family nuclease QatD [Verrucomicrobiota bacterium]